MNVRFVDAHCHVQFDAYSADRNALLARMRTEGVVGVVVGVDDVSSRRAVELAEEHEHIYASVGLHPNQMPDSGLDIELYRGLAQHPKVVAIGECGLDYFRPQSVTSEVKQAQKTRLIEHIKLATDLDKPLIIHARPSKGSVDAYDDLIEIVRGAKQKNPKLRGDIHFFVGGVTEAQALIGLGFTLSFTAVITFARDYDEVIRSIPLTSILSETDAPYVAPAPRRGQRNDPLAVQDVVAALAHVRGEDPSLVQRTLVETASWLFALEQTP